MLLQASGQTNALRALVKAEMDRGPDFLRLANALSALYPRGSGEKRLLDAMLLAVPRCGFSVLHFYNFKGMELAVIVDLKKFFLPRLRQEFFDSSHPDLNPFVYWD